MGVLDERHLREVAAVFFQGEIGHRFWSNVRELRMKAEGGSRRRRRFFRILDEEWHHAVVAPIPKTASVSDGAEVLPEPSSPVGKVGNATRWTAVGALGLGTMVGIEIAVRAIQRRRSARRDGPPEVDR